MTKPEAGDGMAGPSPGRFRRFVGRIRTALGGSADREDRPKTLAVAAILKNEAPYLLEWVAYYRVVGARRIILLDNESSDRSPEILRALADAGIIETGPFAGNGIQLAAMKEMIARAAGACEWLAIVDLDEFLYPTDGSLSVLPALHRLFADRSVGAVAVNWAIYGSSGHEKFFDRPVIERFRRRGPQKFAANRHYKTILRLEAFRKVLNPHAIRVRRQFRTVNSAGSTFELSPKHGLGLSAETTWEGIRINHYTIKSREEFLTIDLPRGRVDTARKFKSPALFEHHDRNEVEDPVNPALLESVKAEMQRLSEIAGCNFSFPSLTSS